ncbi:MAG: YfhO family protein [Candidatus Omnitrophota bacterium]
MISEPLYFKFFLYTLSLYWFGAVSLAAFVKLVRREKTVPLAWMIFLGCIVVDLLVYACLILPYVTWERKDISFNEKYSVFPFPQHRKERLFFKDHFRYFRSSLYKQPTAADATYLSHFDSGRIAVSLSEVIDEIMDGGFSLYKDTLDLNIIDFIAKGKSNYGRWSVKQRFSYLNIFEIVVEDLLVNFHREDPAFSLEDYPFLVALKLNINQGYAALKDSRGVWIKKDEAVDLFRNIMDLNLDPRFQPKNIDLFMRVMIRQWRLYKKINVAGYVNYVWNYYTLPNVNTFVRLKNYDRLLAVFEKSITNSNLPLIRKAIKKSMAISHPLIQFFPKAFFVSRDVYFSLLEKGAIDSDLLYLEGGDDEKKEAGVNNLAVKKGEFSYEVISYGPNSLSLNYKVNSSGYLYFSDGYDRYWQADIDGIKAKVYRANAGFKAVKIPPGKHRVQFRYNPLFFRLSIWCYYLTVIFCLLFLAVKAAGTRNMNISKRASL